MMIYFAALFESGGGLLWGEALRPPPNPLQRNEICTTFANALRLPRQQILHALA